MNKSDSERIALYLENLNFVKTDKRTEADLVILVTCGVRQSAEDRIYGLVPKIKKENKKAKIILTGCLSIRSDVQNRLKGRVDIWLPITELLLLQEKLGIKKKLDSSLSSYLNIEAKHENNFSAFVPIGNGCDNFCTYCVVPYARGRETYRDANDIIDEIKGLVKRGYREVILIAQNVNSYKSHNTQHITHNKKVDFINGEMKNSENVNINFTKLLKMTNDIDGDFWIRFATSHPKDMSDSLIETIAKNKKMCKHIHLPVQAGDDEILDRMNRKYTAEHYIELIKKIRNKIPDASITTDTIVGFPGETKKQFENTAKLYRKVKYDMAYIAQFSPRFGTAAAKLVDDVPKTEKKRREEELMKILRKTALENNKKYIGKTEVVLIWGKNKKGVFYGYTGSNKLVKIKNRESHANQQSGKIKNIKGLIAKFVKIKIIEAEDFGLKGELV